MIDRALKVSVLGRLGIVHDSVLAREIGCSQSIVGRWRCRLGIDRAPKKRFPWEQIEPLLGTMPDGEVAEQFDIVEVTIRRRRRQKGLPVYDRRSRSIYEGVLGTTWDRDCAAAFGVCKSSVSMMRRRRGIPAYAEHRTCVCGNTFAANTPVRRFCSATCSAVFHRVRITEHPEINKTAKRLLPDMVYAIGRLSVAVSTNQEGVHNGKAEHQ